MSALDCPFCDHANPSGAKFCNECGAPLHLAPCGRCGAVNHVADANCYRCGVPSGRAPADAMAVEAQLSEDEALLRGFERELEARDEPEEAPAADAPVAVRLSDIPKFAEQPRATSREPVGFQMCEMASLVNARLEEPSRRWRRYLAGGLAAVLALALPGGYLYQRFEHPPASTVDKPSSVAVPTARRADEPPAPLAALSQASREPSSRVDAVVSEPVPAPAPVARAPEAAPLARCPPAVQAMALCDWAVGAERR